MIYSRVIYTIKKEWNALQVIIKFSKCIPTIRKPDASSFR